MSFRFFLFLGTFISVGFLYSHIALADAIIEPEEEQELYYLPVYDTDDDFSSQTASVIQNNLLGIDIGAVIDLKLANNSLDPDNFSIPGFQVGGEAGPIPNGFSLGHTEINLQGSADDLFYANITLAFHSHGDHLDFDLEEAYVETLGLPVGLSVTAGRFYSDIGYLNTQHEHDWDFVDAPLVYEAFFGRQYNDDGLRLSWLAPSVQYFELGGELFSGNNFPAKPPSSHRTIGSYSLFARTGGDIDISNSWLLGISTLQTKPDGRRGRLSGEHHHPHISHDDHHSEDDFSLFNGRSSVYGAQFVWKWAPNGNPYYRNFKLQTEYYYRHENGEIRVPHDDHDHTTSYEGDQHGWYAQTIYQFMPRWRVGGRFDVLNSHNRGDNESVLREANLIANQNPYRASAMIDYSHSEFSRIRLQYNYDKTQPRTNHLIALQLIVAFGAHSAHQF